VTHVPHDIPRFLAGWQNHPQGEVCPHASNPMDSEQEVVLSSQPCPSSTGMCINTMLPPHGAAVLGKCHSSPVAHTVLLANPQLIPEAWH
jgi:hypothetical protein